MKNFPEYEKWAKNKLCSIENPSVYDWQGMPLAEASARALAICKAAREAPDNVSLILTFFELEKFAEYINEKYQRAWW